MELLPRLRWLGLHLWLAKRGASPAPLGGSGCGVNPLGQPAASRLGPAAARGSQGNTEAWWWGTHLVPENTREPTRKEGLSMKYWDGFAALIFEYVYFPMSPLWLLWGGSNARKKLERLVDLELEKQGFKLGPSPYPIQGPWALGIRYLAARWFQWLAEKGHLPMETAEHLAMLAWVNEQDAEAEAVATGKVPEHGKLCGIRDLAVKMGEWSHSASDLMRCSSAMFGMCPCLELWVLSFTSILGEDDSVSHLTPCVVRKIWCNFLFICRCRYIVCGWMGESQPGDLGEVFQREAKCFTLVIEMRCDLAPRAEAFGLAIAEALHKYSAED